MQKNLGYLSLWKTELYNKFKNYYFILILIFCLLQTAQMISWIILKLFIENKDIEKVGFGLKIDDLPENDNKKKL